MAREVTKVVENIDVLFSQIVVNGEVHESTRYVPPVATQTSSPSQNTQTSTDTEAITDTSVQQTQGEDVYGVELNNVLHDFVDQSVAQALAEEVTARGDADTQLQTNIDNEEMARQQADNGLGQRITAIENVIPNQATSSNQLADKAFVNSSIATNTANFLGTYTSLADIEAIPNPTNNDYAYLETTDTAGNTLYDRYKYSAEDEQWLFEYELNNSSFTAEQWATINSGLTQSSVSSDISSAIEALDVSAEGGNGKYIKKISQTDGKITAEEGNITSSITSGSTDPVTSGAVADALANIDVSEAETAEKLKTARNLKVALGSATAQSFDGSANAESIGVSGTLPVANGGTGQTTAKDACNSFINALDTGSSTPTDNDYYVSQYVDGGATTTTYHRRPMSALWNYIKSKIQSIALTIGSTASAIAETLYGSLTVKNSSGTTTASISQAGAITGASATISGNVLGSNVPYFGTVYSSDTYNSGYYEIARLEGASASGNHSISMEGTVISDWVGDIAISDFYVFIRGYNNEVNISVFNCVGRYVRADLIATYEVFDTNKFRVRLYGVILGNYHRYNTVIKYASTGDVSDRSSNRTVTFPNTRVTTPVGTAISKNKDYNGDVIGDVTGSSTSCTGNSSSADFTRGTAYCTTPGATQAKTASMRGFALQSGATFPITFGYANSYNGVITLNVNSTGAKNIYINGAVTSSSNKTLPAGTYLCRYDGSYYHIDTGYFVTNARNASFATQADFTRGNAVCTTDGATQAKTASMRGFVLTSGATFPITFTNANSYNGVITLNVNSTGAKNIYINNAVTSSSNKTLPAGTYLCRYNGSYYYIDTGYFVTNARNANYASSAGSATTANKIRTSAPSSPADGDIWIQ